MKCLVGLCIVVVALFQNVFAQELACNVIINDQQVQTQDRAVFKEMRKSIFDFINNTKWSNDTFEPHERIPCSILITLTDKSNVNTGVYYAKAQIQSSRTIYNTNYESRMLTFFDNEFVFQYTINKPLIYTENVTTSNLTSMLAFYAYVILGMDYDSFKPMGGNPHYQKMWNLVNIMQSGGNKGWKNLDSRNRYWLAENLNSPQMTPIRQALYDYHMQAMDIFLKEPEKSRQTILEVLKKISEVSRLRSTSILINAFFDAKNEELVELFSQATPEVKQEAVKLLLANNPDNSSKYRKIN